MFLEKQKRLEMDHRLATMIGRSIDVPPTPGLLGKVGARVLGFREDELSTAQRKWQAREISNVYGSSFGGCDIY